MSVYSSKRYMCVGVTVEVLSISVSCKIGDNDDEYEGEATALFNICL